MTAKRAGRRKFAELVPNHLLGDEDRHVLPAVVHGDGVPDHVREDGAKRAPRCGSRVARSAVFMTVDLLQQLGVDVWPFFEI